MTDNKKKLNVLELLRPPSLTTILVSFFVGIIIKTTNLIIGIITVLYIFVFLFFIFFIMEDKKMSEKIITSIVKHPVNFIRNDLLKFLLIFSVFTSSAYTLIMIHKTIIINLFYISIITIFICIMLVSSSVLGFSTFKFLSSDSYSRHEEAVIPLGTIFFMFIFSDFIISWSNHIAEFLAIGLMCLIAFVINFLIFYHNENRGLVNV